MVKLRAYLAHPRILHSEAMMLRDYLLKHMDITIIDPFQHEYTAQWDGGDHSKELADKIVEKDLKWILSCDVIIAYYPEYDSIGTPTEIWFGNKHDKTIFAITQKLDHPWLQYSNVITVRTYVELLQAVKSMLPWKDD